MALTSFAVPPGGKAVASAPIKAAAKERPAGPYNEAFTNSNRNGPDGPAIPGKGGVENPGLPRVLLIGDSISHGYAPIVRELLAGKANVYQLPVNGGPTTNGLAHLTEWLGDKKWDVIHFNWGLHDIRVGRTGNCMVSAADYETNLGQLVKRLKATQATLIWATTTPVPARLRGIQRRSADVITYNARAKKVIDDNGIVTDDLYGRALPQLATIQLPENVHYTAAGYRLLAESVAGSIESALRKK